MNTRTVRFDLATVCLLLITGSFISAERSSAPAAEEQSIIRLVEQFRVIARLPFSPKGRASLLADDYVHVTEDGALTTSWRIVPDAGGSSPMIEKLAFRIFGDLAVASYIWRDAVDQTKTSSIAQVFKKRRDGWRIIATQVGGLNPGVANTIAPIAMVIPKNPPEAEREIRTTWIRQLMAADLKTPSGERAEDLDTIRSIFAEDCIYVNPDGSVLSREQVLARGHPNTVQLSGKKVAEALAANTFFHIDERVVLFGNVAVWTSRNPGNGDQSLRVYLKRRREWQMVFVHHGMSVR